LVGLFLAAASGPVTSSIRALEALPVLHERSRTIKGPMAGVGGASDIRRCRVWNHRGRSHGSVQKRLLAVVEFCTLSARLESVRISQRREFFTRGSSSEYSNPRPESLSDSGQADRRARETPEGLRNSRHPRSGETWVPLDAPILRRASSRNVLMVKGFQTQCSGHPLR
jgi:hypothetical protein